jgi:hypothetical protein
MVAYVISCDATLEEAMTQLKIAHLREKGQDMIIAPLDDSFHHKSQAQQNASIAAIQSAARSAGLRGTVVVIWEDPSGGARFIAPRPWHSFFQSVSMGWVQQNLNKTLSW